jgi:hypothetical protein
LQQPYQQAAPTSVERQGTSGHAAEAGVENRTRQPKNRREKSHRKGEAAMSWEGNKHSKKIQGVPAWFQGLLVPDDKGQPNEQSSH